MHLNILISDMERRPQKEFFIVRFFSSYCVVFKF